MVVAIGFEGSANKLGIGIIRDGEVKKDSWLEKRSHPPCLTWVKLYSRMSRVTGTVEPSPHLHHSPRGGFPSSWHGAASSRVGSQHFGTGLEGGKFEAQRYRCRMLYERLVQIVSRSSRSYENSARYVVNLPKIAFFHKIYWTRAISHTTVGGFHIQGDTFV